MRFISFGECNKYLIFPLIGGLCKLILNSIIYLIQYDLELDDHPFCEGINAGFGMGLAIIPYLIISKYSKNAKKKELEKHAEEVEKKKNPNLTKEKYIIIFLCSFLDFLQKILVFIFQHNIYNNIWLFDIIFLNLFDFMLNKNHLYKHHYLSGGIMLLFGIGFNAINLLNIKLNEIPLLFLSIFIEIIYSLTIVLAKNGIEYKFCSPFELTFYEGLFALFLNVVFLAISSYIPLSKNFTYLKLLSISEYNGRKYLDHFLSYFGNMSFIEALLFIITMLNRVFFNLFTHFTLKYFNSSHVVFILICGEISLDWQDKSAFEIASKAIIMIIELFMLLIFCERLELNFCGLDENTKRNMEKRLRLTIYDDESCDSKEIWKGLELSDNESRTSNQTSNNSFLGI